MSRSSFVSAFALLFPLACGGAFAGGSEDGGGGSGGSGGGTATGGAGGSAGVDPRCQGKAPSNGASCSVNGVHCSYQYSNKCLCAPVNVYSCTQVDPSCTASAMSGDARFAPPALDAAAPPPDQGGAAAPRPPSDGGPAVAPVPPVTQCVCAANSWSCLPY